MCPVRRPFVLLPEFAPPSFRFLYSLTLSHSFSHLICCWGSRLGQEWKNGTYFPTPFFLSIHSHAACHVELRSHNPCSVSGFPKKVILNGHAVLLLASSHAAVRDPSATVNCLHQKYSHHGSLHGESRKSSYTRHKIAHMQC